MNHISAVIPTRNRENLAVDTVFRLLNQSYKPKDIIVVDSSNEPSIILAKIKGINYIHTQIKSAAKQRNIALEIIPSICTHVIFVDDDIVFSNNYIEKLLDTMIKLKCIGVSGITKSIICLKSENMIIRIIKRFFYLDGKEPGKVLKSGVNIPIQYKPKESIEVDWLIGCSLWDYNKISDLRFESDFEGSSLSEDVIFSLNAKNRGKLIVNTEIQIDHNQSLINRDSNLIFEKNWVRNHFRVVIKMKQKKMVRSLFPFWMSVFARYLINFSRLFLNPISSIFGLVGTTLGIVTILREHFEN